MSDSIEQKSDKGIVQKLWDKATRFWPISILLMAFTFLSQIEEVEKFSKYLSQFLDEWQQALHYVIELPINALLKVLGRPLINIPSPIPEYITIFGLLIFTYFRKKHIEKLKWVDFILRKQWAFRYSYTEPILERYTVKTVFMFVTGNVIGLFLLLWSMALIGFVLFTSNHDLALIGYRVLLMPICILFFLFLLWKPKDESWDETIELYGYVVAPMIILTSVAIVVLAVALEIIVPSTISFIDRANSP